MMKKVTVKKFKYVLDWYSITDVEIDLDDYCHIEIQERLKSWYILFFKVGDDGYAKQCLYESFQLDQPWDAVAKLQSKIQKYSTLHGNRDFSDMLSTLLIRAASSDINKPQPIGKE